MALGQHVARRSALSPQNVRVVAIGTAFVVNVTLLAALFVSLIIGPRRSRSIRSMLALMTLVAAWLTLTISWPEVAWSGQKWRMSRQLAAFEPLVDELRREWPAADGIHSALGPFMAYPRGNPSTLMLLAPRSEQSSTIPIASVERSSGGAISFELTGSELGAWLEWHPVPGSPGSFISGLETAYKLERSEPLKDGWFLTRYL